MHNATGYGLIIEGCPIIFTTPGINENSIAGLSTAAGFYANATTASLNMNSYAFGALDPNTLGELTEEINLLDGTFNADGMTFRIFDVLKDYTDPVQGTNRVNIASYLFTKSDQTTYFLSSSLLANFSTGSLKLLGNTGYPTTLERFNFWVENEAMSGIITSPADEIQYTRNQLGTTPVEHLVFSSSNYYPTVYFQYPGVYRQKVQLWRRNENGIWSCLWRGVGGRAPRSTSDGSAIELQCEHFWTDFRNKKVAVEEASATVTGWDARKLGFKKYQKFGNFYTQYTSPADYYFLPPTTQSIRYSVGHPSRWDYGLLTQSMYYGNQSATAASTEFFYNWGRPNAPMKNSEDMGEGFFSLIPPSPEESWVIHVFGSYGATGSPIDSRGFRSFNLSEKASRSDDEGNGFKIKVPVPGGPTFQTFKNGATAAENNDLFINRLNSIKEFNFINSGSQATCLKRSVFVGEIDAEDYQKPVYPVSSGFADPISEPTDGYRNTLRGGAHAARKFYYYCQENSFNWYRQSTINTSNENREPIYFVSGSPVFKNQDLSKISETYDPLYNGNSELKAENWRQIHFVQSEFEIKHNISLRSRHWLDLIRYGLVDNYRQNVDFDFSYSNYLKLKLENPSYLTEIFLDSEKSVGEIMQAFSQFYGIYPATTTDGKMRFFKLEKPTDYSSSSLSLTSRDYIVKEKPNWEAVGDNVVTTVIANSEGFSGGKLIINNQYSKAKYGDGQTIEIDLDKLGIEDAIFQRQDPAAWVSAELISSLIAKFKDPYFLLTFHLPLTYYNRVWCGDIITATDWLLPDGSGGRGLDAKKLLVSKKVTNLQEGRVSISCINFPEKRSYGFSPCLRISSISLDTKTLVVSQSGYINTGRTEGPTDYSGANLGGYFNTANDGGIGFFTVGDKIQLILRDSTTFSTASFTVASKTSNTIVVSETISTASVDWAGYSLLNKVDCRFDTYNTTNIQHAQQNWAYIGDGDTRQIKSIDPIQQIVLV